METKKKINNKKTLTKLPTKQPPYFFPQTAGAYVWASEDESAPFFFRASPSSSPLLQTVVALLSPSLSPSLSLCVSLSPPISFCLLPPKIALILQYIGNRSSFMSTAASSGNKTCLCFFFFFPFCAVVLGKWSVLGIKLFPLYRNSFNCSSLGSLVTYLVLPQAREYLLFSSLLFSWLLLFQHHPPKT